MANPGPGPGGTLTLLNITAATVVKASPSLLFRVSVSVAGSAAGAVYDAATTGGNTAANLIGPVASAITTSPLDFGGWPCATGILIVPPTGGTVAVAFT